MGDLTLNFSLDEFTASATARARGIANTPTPDALRRIKTITAPGMQQLRTLYGRAVVITNAYRNPEVNRLVGGVATSDHPEGYAVDYHVAGLSDLEAAQIARDAARQTIDGRPFVFDQLIYEGTPRRPRCVHISFDPQKRFQVLTQPRGPGTGFLQGIVAR